MEKERNRGIVPAVVWIVLIFVAGLYIAHLPFDTKTYKNDEFGPLMPSDDPHFVQDQIFARKMSRITRGLEDDFRALEMKFKNLPPYKPPRDDRLSEGQVERYITAVKSYSKEFENFNKRTMQGRPGFFRMMATVGMMPGFHKVTKKRALVKAQMTDKEFDWVVHRLVETILYCVNYKLENDEDMEDKVKIHLQNIQGRCYRILDMHEHVGNQEFVVHHEKFKPNQIPRRNIRLFLENYPDIRYSGINFRKPSKIEFDKEAILRSVSNNPP